MKLVLNIILLLSIVPAQAMQLTRVGRLGNALSKHSMHGKSFCTTQSPVQFLHKHFEELIASPEKRMDFEKRFNNSSELDQNSVRALFSTQKNSYLQEINKEMAGIKDPIINGRMLCGVGALTSFTLVGPTYILAFEVANKCADITGSDVIGAVPLIPIIAGSLSLTMIGGVLMGAAIGSGSEFNYQVRTKKNARKREQLFEKQKAVQELSEIFESKK
ncbi:MAG: hypothetical protein WC707_00735 [Candidatus Babeliaceae bacterium]|jgi:hypothetical protein